MELICKNTKSFMGKLIDDRSDLVGSVETMKFSPGEMIAVMNDLKFLSDLLQSELNTGIERIRRMFVGENEEFDLDDKYEMA